MSLVATRFAPSPTGPLHIGGVRTALFNWLFSKNNKGKFYLRIEDTDKERSKEEYKKQIVDSLNWIGINHDDKEYIQSKNINKHKEIAEKLLKNGFAYRCYCSEEEIKEQKEKCKKKGIPYFYNRKWRDPKNLEIPKNVKPVIRFKSKISGDSMIDAGINDGDTVIVKKTNTANNGQIVVALIDEHEAMLKRIRKKGKVVALESANKRYETKIFGPDRVKVQGVLVSLYRNFQ